MRRQRRRADIRVNAVAASMLPIGESNYQREPPTRSRSPSLCTWSMVDATARVREDALAIAEPTLERSVELAARAPAARAPSRRRLVRRCSPSRTSWAGLPIQSSPKRRKPGQTARSAVLARCRSRELTSVCDDVRGRAGTRCGVPPRDEPRERAYCAARATTTLWASTWGRSACLRRSGAPKAALPARQRAHRPRWRTRRALSPWGSHRPSQQPRGGRARSADARAPQWPPSSPRAFSVSFRAVIPAARSSPCPPPRRA